MAEALYLPFELLFYKKLIDLHPEYIKFIAVNFQTLEMCENVIKKMPELLKYCKYQTIDMCEYVVSRKPHLIQYTFYQTLCILSYHIVLDIIVL